MPRHVHHQWIMTLVFLSAPACQRSASCLRHARQLTKEAALGLLLTNRNSSTLNQSQPERGRTREAFAAAGFMCSQLLWNFILALQVVFTDALLCV